MHLLFVWPCFFLSRLLSFSLFMFLEFARSRVTLLLRGQQCVKSISN